MGANSVERSDFVRSEVNETKLGVGSLAITEGIMDFYLVNMF